MNSIEEVQSPYVHKPDQILNSWICPCRMQVWYGVYFPRFPYDPNMYFQQEKSVKHRFKSSLQTHQIG